MTVTAAATQPLVFTMQTARTPAGWWVHVWARDHVEYFGPYRWRFIAALMGGIWVGRLSRRPTV